MDQQNGGVADQCPHPGGHRNESNAAIDRQGRQGPWPAHTPNPFPPSALRAASLGPFDVAELLELEAADRPAAIWGISLLCVFVLIAGLLLRWAAPWARGSVEPPPTPSPHPPHTHTHLYMAGRGVLVCTWPEGRQGQVMAGRWGRSWEFPKFSRQTYASHQVHPSSSREFPTRERVPSRPGHQPHRSHPHTPPFPPSHYATPGSRLPTQQPADRHHELRVQAAGDAGRDGLQARDAGADVHDLGARCDDLCWAVLGHNGPCLANDALWRAAMHCAAPCRAGPCWP
jgi:hypothetical protein